MSAPESSAATQPEEKLREALGDIALRFFGSGEVVLGAHDALDTLVAERDRYREALAGIANADTKYPSMPSGFTGDWESLRDEARAVLTEDDDGVWE